LPGPGTAQPADPLSSGLFRCYVVTSSRRRALPSLKAKGDGPVAARPIIRFPDPRLRLKAEPITVIDKGIQVLAQDLTETMHAAPGIGITAPHIGVLKRLVVIQLEADPAPQVYINPQIVWISPGMIRHREGSVSMPGVTDEVERHSKVKVVYQGLDGAEHEEESEGLMAVCLQHEIDQLDGIFWIDRLSRLKRDRLIKRFEKLQRVRA
jgi:peptide deformylase